MPFGPWGGGCLWNGWSQEGLARPGSPGNEGTGVWAGQSSAWVSRRETEDFRSMPLDP